MHDAYTLERDYSAVALIAFLGRLGRATLLLWLAMGKLLLLGQAEAIASEYFFEGKTLKIIVGFSPGGGQDRNARVLARHLGKHIPGAPAVVVENKPGAGGRIATNHLYSSAPHDGTTLGMIPVSLIFMQKLGDAGLREITQDFGWLGAPTTAQYACFAMARTGVRNLDDLLKPTIALKAGAIRPGTVHHDMPILLNMLLGTRFQVVPGFKGSSKIKLALIQGEVDSVCASVDSILATARDLLDGPGDSRLVPLVVAKFAGASVDSELAELPQLPDIISDEAGRELFRLWLQGSLVTKSLAVPPGTPPHRINILRAALQATLEDPAFLADAAQARLTIAPVSGTEVEQLVRSLRNMSSTQAQKLKEILRVDG